MNEQSITVFVDVDLTARDIRVDLGLHALPTLRPEPRLGRGHGDDGVELDHAITLDDFDLIARLEPGTTTDRDGEGENATCLDRCQLALSAHTGSLAAVLRYRKAVTR